MGGLANARTRAFYLPAHRPCRGRCDSDLPAAVGFLLMGEGMTYAEWNTAAWKHIEDLDGCDARRGAKFEVANAILERAFYCNLTPAQAGDCVLMEMDMLQYMNEHHDTYVGELLERSLELRHERTY